MSEDQVDPRFERCAHCGAYLDAMGNSDAISRVYRGEWHTWCDGVCLRAWVREAT